MSDLKELMEVGLKFHGHKCPAMPMGLRAGMAAMQALGTEHSQDKELHVISETGKGHAAGCFLDGIMTATGCTYGKSNIEKIYHNKMAFTLIEVATGRSVRVKLKDEFMKKALKSPFIDYRKKGIPPQEVPADIADPIVDNILSMPEEAFIEVGEIKTVEFKRGKGCFEMEHCDSCGDLTFTNKLDETENGKVCTPCKGES